MDNSELISYGLYTIDINYIKYLHSVDLEVYYDGSRPYEKKPYIGVLIGLGTHKYFIPLTSAKAKHERWDLSDDDHILICEKVNTKSRQTGEYYKSIDQNPYALNHILASIMFSKMIPVKDGLYSYIDVNKISDKTYHNLLMKEYAFCLNEKGDILDKATKAYNRQISTSKILPYYVNYKKLESAADKYSK